MTRTRSTSSRSRLSPISQKTASHLPYLIRPLDALQTANDELVWDQVRSDVIADESVRDAGEANTIDNFAHVFDRKLEEILISRMDRNRSQVVRFLNIPAVREFIARLMRNQVYSRIQQNAKSEAAEA
jgi:type I restriction enzyme R subunit